MSLRWIKKTVTISEFKDETSYQRFRQEVLRRLFSIRCQPCGYLNEPQSTECTQCRLPLGQEILGVVKAREIVDTICVERSKPVTTKELTEYAELIEAACNALPQIIEELRDEFARDVEGNKIVGDDGEWVTKTPMLITPLTATADPAWGAYNRTEAFATAKAMPTAYVGMYKTRAAIVAGMQKAEAKRIAVLKNGHPTDPILVGLIDGVLDAPDAQLRLPESE